MPYVIAESYIWCKYTDCVTVCPMDRSRAGPNFLVIDPDECIDCSICVPECPVGATYPTVKVPADRQDFIALNAQLSCCTNWPRLAKVQAPLQDHVYWTQVKDRRDASVTAPD